MLSFKNKTVGRANYTLRDYYHDILKDNSSAELGEEARKALDWLNVHDLCKCGHEKNVHSKFIDAKFAGCQACVCEKFLSYVK